MTASEREKLLHIEAQIYNSKGTVHGLRGNLNDSLDSFLKSLSLEEKIGNTRVMNVGKHGKIFDI